MNAVDLAFPRLKTEEGFRARAYKDTNGFTTIGYGFNVDAGISPYAAAALLQAQAEEMHLSLMRLPWYPGLVVPVQSVCLDIAINEGLGGLLKFPHMIAALAHGDLDTAATECAVADPVLDASRYAPLRAIIKSAA